MSVVKKYFKGGLNSDVDPSLLPEGDYLNAMNVRISGGDDGGIGVLRPVPGIDRVYTVARDRASHANTSTQDVKHMVVDEVNGYIYMFVSGTVVAPPGFPGGQPSTIVEPYIRRCNIDGTSQVNILLSSSVRVNWDIAGNTDYNWDNLVQAKVVGPNLVWINKDGYQFSFNVDAYLNAGGVDPTKPFFLSAKPGRDEISLIKRPPALPLVVSKFDDPNVTSDVNFIKNDAFQFAYRYRYVGYEYSVPSPWSSEMPVNSDGGPDYNAVSIIIDESEIPPSNIMSIELIAKSNITGAINIVHRWNTVDSLDRQAIENHINGIGQLTYTFYNDKVFETLDNASFSKQFDSVPVKSGSIEVAKDRLFLANNTEGYNPPVSTSLSATVNSSAPSQSKTTNVKRINITFLVRTEDQNTQDRVDFNYEYTAYAVYLPELESPGWYELFANNGRYSNTGFSISAATADECTLDSATTDLTVALSGAKFLYLSGFSNTDNNGWYYIKPGTVLAGSVDLRKLYPGDGSYTLVNENSGGSLTITMDAMSCLIDDSTGNPVPTVPTPTPPANFSAINYSAINPTYYRGSSLSQYFNNVKSYVRNHILNDLTIPGYDIISVGTASLYEDVNTSYTITINNIGDSNLRSFKSDSRYTLGIQFYDWAMRPGGVVTKPSLTLDIPDRDYGNSTLAKFIDWTLPSGTQTEIPIWAKYYSIVRTDNLSTRYFIQGETDDITSIITNGMQLFYIKKDADGVWDVVQTLDTWGGQISGIAIDIDPLLNKGFGYIFQEGDILKLYNKDNASLNCELPIIDTVGKYIIAQPKDLGTLDDTDAEWRYEIRRPYKSSSMEPFYETGVYKVNNYGTNTRSYSQLSGVIEGDVYTSGAIEYMNLNQEFRNTWLRNLGRPCFVNDIGQVYSPSQIRWSNTFIPGTKINGLSTFDALDFEDLPVELGPVNKLQLTSKAQSEGTVMLAIGQNLIASLYLGETSVVDNAAQSFLATSGKVVGTVNILRGRFGTTVPSSVVEYDGNVYGLDLLNECVWRYSSNGLYAISDNGMRNFWRSYCKQLKSEINEFNVTQSPVAYGGYNPATDEYILCFKTTTYVAPTYGDGSGVQRYSDPRIMYSTSTPAELYSVVFKSMSIGFSVSDERWTSFYTHRGPYVYYAGRMYSFVESIYDGILITQGILGGLYIHNKDSATNTFGGRVRDSFISFTLNEAPNNIKIFQAMSIEGDDAPTTTYLETNQPNNQLTTMVDADFIEREGQFYSPVYRDRMSPNVSGSADEKMFTGDKMRGNYALVSMHWAAPTGFNVRFVNLDVKNSIGHKLNQQ